MDRAGVRQDVITEHLEPTVVTDAERLCDIKEKLDRWAYLSHHPEAERDMRWLLGQLDEYGAHIALLEERLKQYQWAFRLP